MYFLLNVIGLSIGLVCGLLIFFLISYHLSFNRFHKETSSIYRIVSETFFGNEDYSQGISQPLGKVLRNEYTYFDHVAMYAHRGKRLISVDQSGQVSKYDEEIAYAEPEYFKIFNFPLLKGDAARLIAAPGAALITQSVARKFFKDEDPVGKRIKVENQFDFEVAGVLKDIPVNSDKQDQIYLSYHNFKDADAYLASDRSWGSISSGIQCFVKLRPGTAAGQVESIFPLILKKYNPREARFYQFFMQPLRQLHFDTRFDGVISKKYLWSMGAIGCLLLLTVCINFINIATAHALRRSKEIGIRKALGSRRQQVFKQFITETFLIGSIALILSIIAVIGLVPACNRLFGTHILMQPYEWWLLIAAALFLLVIVVCASGIYPGLILARLNPVNALKNDAGSKNGHRLFTRKVLVIVQFSIVQLMLIGVIVIGRQMHYSLHSDIGVHKEGIVLVDLPKNNTSVLQYFRNQVSGLNGVEAVSYLNTPPISDERGYTDFIFDNRPKKEPYEICELVADAGYVSLFGLRMIAGTNFRTSDSLSGVLVNETLMRKTGITDPERIIGKTFVINRTRTLVTGVVKDFHNQSFQGVIDPIVIYANRTGFTTAAIKLNLKQLKPAMAAIKKAWGASFPEYNYSYRFMDETIAEMYATETALLTLVEIFSVIAIVISCLGLYGLVSFMAAQRVKEVGVRKVLGARVLSILWLFIREFLYLLLVAFVIAAPVAGWLMYHWLKDFSYRVHLDVGIFAAVMLLSAFIVIATIFYTAIKAARSNPVKALRSE